MSKLEELYRLQKLDSKINRLQAELTELGEAKEAKIIDKEIIKLQKKINQQQESEQEKKKELKAKEFENNRLSRQLEEYQEKLYSGESSAKELEQLQLKISKVENEQSELEDQILDLMLEQEEIVELGADLKEKLKLKEQELINLEGGYKEERSKIESELKQVKINRESLNQALGEQELQKYKSLLLSKSGLAVVKLKDGYCMGCRVALPTRLEQQVQAADELIKCESCGRILYWSED